jgi:1,2-diacylglycerol 3-beta-galactosyltransferase
MEMARIGRALDGSGLGVQLILLCGRHEKAARELRSLTPRIPMFVEGFTSGIPKYMALADFFIGKAGPGSISEALAMRLPVIVERNAWTLAHERYNADWIEERELGIVLPSFSRIAGGVGERFRRNAAAIHNSAVFEIPALLSEILRAA